MTAYPPALDAKLKVLGPMRCDGVGGMVLAQTEAGQRVAVRWFASGSGGASALAALGKLPVHPALPRLAGFGQETSCDWAAVDCPDGMLLDVRTLSPEQLQAVGAALAGALAVLHAAQIVHGELAADSILTLPGGAPLLFDVAAAVANRATERRGERRALALLSRTAACLSPERARGGEMTPETDVYALGAVLCGARDVGPALARLHESASGALKLEAPAGLSAPLRALVAKMVDPDPTERPTAAEVAAALAPPVDPFDALLQEKEVSAKGMAPGHEATLVDPVAPPARTTEESLEAVLVDALQRARVTATYEELEAVSAPAPRAVPTHAEPATEAPLRATPTFRELPLAVDGAPPTQPESAATVAPATETPPTHPERVATVAPVIEAPLHASPLHRELAAVALTDPPAPRAFPVSVRRSTPASLPVPRRSFRHSASTRLGWLAATNTRLGALAACATLCILITLMTLGEHRSRRALHASPTHVETLHAH